MSDVGLFLLMFAGLLLLLGVIRFLAWLTELQDEHGSVTRATVNTIKRYVAPRPRVMSHGGDDAPPYVPSLRETADRQTPDKPAPVLPSRSVMLNTFKLLRKYGIPREEARPVLKAAGWPLDNNLWTEAAPADDEPAHVTPIVGRATSARFEQTDADYPYQSPV